MYQIQRVNDVYCLVLSQGRSHLAITMYKNYSFWPATAPTCCCGHEWATSRPLGKRNRAWMNAEGAELLS